MIFLQADEHINSLKGKLFEQLGNRIQGMDYHQVENLSVCREKLFDSPC